MSTDYIINKPIPLNKVKKIKGIKVKKFKNYNLISIKGQKDFKAFNLNVGGDFSSASFFILLTLLSKNSRLKIKSVNLNPTRLGAFKILKKMVILSTMKFLIPRN